MKTSQLLPICGSAIIASGVTNVNNNEILVPELLALESLSMFLKNTNYGNVVHTDFGQEIKKYGETITITRPKMGKMKRKRDGETVENRATENDSIQVTLNQHVYDSFMLYDGELTLSRDELYNRHLFPSIQALAEGINSICASQTYRFLSTAMVGSIGSALSRATLLKARKKLNDNKIPMSERYMALTSEAETQLLSLDDYAHMDKSGDPVVMRDALIGRKEGVTFFVDLSQPSPLTNPNTPIATTITAAAVVGAATVAVADATGLLEGGFITIAGDNQPHRITTIATLNVTFTPALNNPVANGAAFTFYAPSQVNQGTTIVANGSDGTTAGYMANWHKGIVVDTGALPAVGQMVAFGTDTNIYGVISVDTSTSSFYIDRPLVNAVADNAKVFYGPAGNYNLMMHRGAIGLISRPLLLPRVVSGNQSAYVAADGYALRILMSYNSDLQGTKITVDMLLGVAIMYQEAGCVVLC